MLRCVLCMAPFTLLVLLVVVDNYPKSTAVLTKAALPHHDCLVTQAADVIHSGAGKSPPRLQLLDACFPIDSQWWQAMGSCRD